MKRAPVSPESIDALIASQGTKPQQPLTEPLVDGIGAIHAASQQVLTTMSPTDQMAWDRDKANNPTNNGYTGYGIKDFI